MNPYTNGELDTFLSLQTSIEVPHRSKNSQTSPYCPMCVIFVRLGIAEVHEEPVTKELGDVSLIALDDLDRKSTRLNSSH